MENQGINNNNNNSLNNEDIINSQKNEKTEIEILKKEINDLKEQRQRDQKNILELKSLFQTEIKKLNEKIKSLSNEIKTIKSNQKEDDNNINNVNIDDDFEENIENKDNKYSLECLSRKLSIDIIKGTERTNLDIAVRNNSKLKFPENSYLVCDTKKSLLCCDDVDLSQLEPNEQKIVNIQFKNLKYISKGSYKCIIILMIENKVYKSSSIELTINVIEPIINENNQQNNNMNNFGINNNLNFNNNLNNYNNLNLNPFLQNDVNNIVSTFREQFSLFDYESIPDEKIKSALMTNNNDFNKAFASLFD